MFSVDSYDHTSAVVKLGLLHVSRCQLDHPLSMELCGPQTRLLRRQRSQQYFVTIALERCKKVWELNRDVKTIALDYGTVKTNTMGRAGLYLR